MSTEPFRFYTERRLVELTGLNARTLPQLLAILREVPGASVFYHTHQRFLSHHFEKPMVYNDFAVWVGEALLESALAEQLAAIDMFSFTSIRQIREALLRVIEIHARTGGGRMRECPEGDEFHFCKSRSFVMPLGTAADSVPDFFAALPALTNNSLYFHFFESRLRLEHATNDFSQWLEAHGEAGLARAINALDPYALSLDELKSEIIELGRKNGVPSHAGEASGL